MRKKLILIAALFLQSQLIVPASAQATFAERLVLDPAETCTSTLPEEGGVIALALRGAKGRNYLRAGGEGNARLSVRGNVDSAYFAFQALPASEPGTVALYNLGQARFVRAENPGRIFADAEPAAALKFIFEETGDGYYVIKLAGSEAWMSMSDSGYIGIRPLRVAAPTQFCPQTVVAE